MDLKIHFVITFYWTSTKFVTRYLGNIESKLLFWIAILGIFF
jgi:hypothetical protein